MKAMLFLLLALRASFASACAHYSYCHCMNSDGKPNNAATETVCNGEGAGVGTLMTDTWDYGSSTTYKDCLAQAGCWDNCSWRQDCQNAGATGSDSVCRHKCLWY